MDESGINLNFDFDEYDEERILEIVKPDIVNEVLSQLPNTELENFDFYELRSKPVQLSLSLDESPTLKDEVVESRTQLKQQLMRDQELQREQEKRREAEFTERLKRAAAEPVQIPFNVSNVRVPPHVLQVRSELENPTKYHILAKQKNQLMQFLNESPPQDFIDKFDAERASLQIRHQEKQVKLQTQHHQQLSEQRTKHELEKKELEQQQQLQIRKKLQKRRQIQLQFQECWQEKQLEYIKTLETDEEKAKQLRKMEQEHQMHLKRQQRQLIYFQRQQCEEQLEQYQQMQEQHQLERQQLLQQHTLENQQLQQQFELERQQLGQQHEKVRMRQLIEKEQRQQALEIESEAEARADAEAIAEAMAEAENYSMAFLQAFSGTNQQVQPQNENQGQVQAPAQAEAQSQEQLQTQEEEEIQNREQEKRQKKVEELNQEQNHNQEKQQEEEETKQELNYREMQVMQEIQEMHEMQELLPQLMLSPGKKLQLPEIQQNGQATASAQPSQNPSPEVVSPALNSVATSFTSDADDALDGPSFDNSSAMSDKGNGSSAWNKSMIATMSKADVAKQKISHSCPSGLQNSAQDLAPFGEPVPKDRIKKDNHNIIERRRRSNINERIKELGALLPKTNDPHYDEVVKDSKQNKGSILKSSVDYIKILKHHIQKLKQIELDNQKLLEENRKLLSRVRELEKQVEEFGLTVENEIWQIIKPDTMLESDLNSDWGPRDLNNIEAKPEASAETASAAETNLAPIEVNAEAESRPGTSQCDRMDEDTE